MTLTRNGHGAGFWDGDWEDTYTELDNDGNQTVRTSYPTVGDFLTAMSKPYGEFNLYVGDNGIIYGT